MHKIIVAITGGIGSGKSTFANYLESKGYVVINADDISKNILSFDEKIKKKISKEFGSNAYKDGKLNKKFIASQVFSNPANLHKLNSILHPQVLQKIDTLIKIKYKDENIVFIEAALIYEADIEKIFNYVILVTADLNIRLKRSIKSGKFTEDDFIKRDKNQIPQQEKEKRADFIFSNNGSKNDLIKKADLLLLTLNSG
ncbi:MAG: dephospho-CoA kinase [Ignavibacteriaceae bacterium]